MGAAVADDGGSGEPGKPVSKSMSQSGQETTTVEGYVNENEHAFVSLMKFYVPMQAANGATHTNTGAEVFVNDDYYNIDGDPVETRDLAKPLVGVYMNGPVEGVEGTGFTGHGLRDAYASVSLDDGVTWKNTNLSESAAESSIDLERNDIKLYKKAGLYKESTKATKATKDTKAKKSFPYPGDVSNIFHAVAGNNVLVAWQSRFCSSGQPNYSLDNPDPSPEQFARRAAIAAELGIDLATASPDDLYLIDMFQVGGSQGSVDYAEDKWEQNWPVGEVPFNCLWTARGELVQGDDPRTEEVTEETYMRWFKPERLTSGRRDVNRIETMCVDGAGCAITWQEDPDGLRPGQGEGPGEGWSGAIANSQTDVWYSYIDSEYFDVVQNPTDETGATPMTLADYELAAAASDITQKPKPFIPFAMPMRLTDNAKCNPDNPAPYCFGSALDETDAEIPFPDADATIDEYGLRDLCTDIIEVPAGKDHDGDGVVELKPVCVTDDDLPLVGNTASTRPRLGLYGYDSDGDVVGEAGYQVNSAFAVVVAEEDKGLGAFGFDSETGESCPLPDSHDDEGEGGPDPTETCLPFDEGKNMWYHSFSMSLTDPLADDPKDGLYKNLTFHGNMLNQPEVDWETGVMFEPENTVDMWDFTGDDGADYNYDIYNTEIARRGSLLAQDIAKADAASSGLIALPTWKQGTMNQGGPADVMSRRIVIPDDWSATSHGNPYAFRNMECTGTRMYADGSNPNYPDGLCLGSAINLSATIPDTCTNTDETVTDTTCPTLSEGDGDFLWSDTNPILQGVVQGEGNTDKVLSWHQCQPGGVYTDVDGVEQTCPETDAVENGTVTDRASTLADQSWYNPLDVAKGHRGFLDGDMVMMLYAWSPNWRLNAKGSDRYELYIRRSFDGAMSWTTLPSPFRASDGVDYHGQGTVTCETYRSLETQSEGEIEEPHACTTYDVGAPEQARNVTQHKSMRITTLDPRFAMTGSPQGVSNTSDLFGELVNPYDEDVRDPSRYFVVYETGDNTTTEFGEPQPLDLFYSRAVNFGDDYQVWAEETDLETDLSVCYPSDPHEDLDVPTELVDSGFCNEFDQLDQGTPSIEGSEASLAANPGGEFLYGAWAQLEHEDDELVASDAMVRRVWWIDDYVSETYGWDFGQGSGTGVPATE